MNLNQESVYSAISDPTRREILDLLKGGEKTVGEIAGKFKISRPAISKHLNVLKGAGLVSTRQVGTSTVCGLTAYPLRAVQSWIANFGDLGEIETPPMPKTARAAKPKPTPTRKLSPITGLPLPEGD